MGWNQIPPSLHTRRLNSSYHRHEQTIANALFVIAGPYYEVVCLTAWRNQSIWDISKSIKIYIYMRTHETFFSAQREMLSPRGHVISSVISYLLSALRMLGNGLMTAVVVGTTTTWTTTQQLMQLTGVENPESGEAIHIFGFAGSELSHMLRWISVTNCARIVWLNFQIDEHPKGFLAWIVIR